MSSSISIGLDYFIHNNSGLPECANPLSAGNTIRHFTQVTYANEREKLSQACPTPCQQLSYTLNTRKYHTNTWIEYDNQPVEDFSKVGVVLGMAYESFIVEERIESLVYDLGTFLSAVGGNLGLFLGFSCLTVLLGIVKLARKLQKHKCFRSFPSFP